MTRYREDDEQDEYMLSRNRDLASIPTMRLPEMRTLIGKKISQMHSLPVDSLDFCIDFYKNSKNGKDFELHNIFSLCATVLAIVFADDTCISLSSNDEIGSVMVEVGPYDEIILEDYKEFDAPADDPIYSTREWAAVIGKVIAGFSVIYRKEKPPGSSDRPFESGVMVHLTDGSCFVYGDDVRKACSNPSVFFQEDLRDPQDLIIKRLV